MEDEALAVGSKPVGSSTMPSAIAVLLLCAQAGSVIGVRASADVPSTVRRFSMGEVS